jgi:hypothetical protein
MEPYSIGAVDPMWSKQTKEKRRKKHNVLKSWMLSLEASPEAWKSFIEVLRKKTTEFLNLLIYF